VLEGKLGHLMTGNRTIKLATTANNGNGRSFAKKLSGGTKGMKKFLVFVASAVLILSTAAVSLAAPTFSGDFKYNMYEDESAATQHYGETDLLMRISGNVSDSVYATANFEWLKQSTAAAWTAKVDEFYATAKQSWGTVKMGYYEYKFTPSRVELSSANFKVLPKCDATFEVNVPVGNGFVIDGIIEPYKNADGTADDGTYGVAVNYKAENWGAKFTYVDLKLDRDVTAIDAYYMVHKDMKVFVDAVDYSEVDTTKYDDGLDPVVGIAWANVADTKINAAFEYALNSRTDSTTSDDYNEYILKATYKFANNIGLEFYHYVVGDGKNKEKLRLRYQF
jgi:hypothetical protein